MRLACAVPPAAKSKFVACIHADATFSAAREEQSREKGMAKANGMRLFKAIGG